MSHIWNFRVAHSSIFPVAAFAAIRTISRVNLIGKISVGRHEDVETELPEKGGNRKNQNKEKKEHENRPKKIKY